jgi:hypothetical protein
VNFRARSSTIREWLTTCQKTHPKCRVNAYSDALSAARVIAIGTPVDGPLQLKLVRTANLGSLVEQYTVLSHCWGEGSISCSTTTKTVSRYESEGVHFETLPRTFQEAVQITAAIGIKYIWIDSICIIQDDVQDWETEAAKMGAIFRDAVLTISATNACNCHEGCGLTTAFEPAVHFKGSYRAPLDFAIRETKPMHEEVQDRLGTAPVNTRAWIFQERLLSRRVLHATHAQFVWQCATCAETEDGILYDDGKSVSQYYNLGMHLNPPFQKKFSDPARGHRWEPDWWTAVQDYTRRTLGRPSDRYAAFAGAVRLFQEISGDDPFVGLWRENLHLHLCWRVYKDKDFSEPDNGIRARLIHPQVRRPSWTWMSYPHNGFNISAPHLDWHAVTARDRMDHAIRVTYQAQVVHSEIHWTREPLTSTPYGTISIRGICAGPWEAHDQVHTEIPHHQWEQRPEVVEEVSLNTAFDIGVPMETRMSGKYEKLALVSYLFSKCDLRTIYLFVEPAIGGSGAEYVRIGCFEEVQCIYPRTEYAQPPGVWKEITLV